MNIPRRRHGHRHDRGRGRDPERAAPTSPPCARYRSAVGLRTREVVQTLAPGAWDEILEPRGHDARRRGRRLRAQRRLDRGRGHRPWQGHGRGDQLGQTAIRHNTAHIGEARHDPRAGRLRPSRVTASRATLRPPTNPAARETHRWAGRVVSSWSLSSSRPSSRSSARWPPRTASRRRRSWSASAPSRAPCSASRSWTGRPTTCSSTSTTGCSTATPRPSSPSRCWPTSWKIVNDTTWEFKLRKGVKFHNGEPFTAASVKATIDYALDPGQQDATTPPPPTGGWSRKSRSSTTTRCASSPSSRGRTWSTARRLTNSLIMPAKALKELGPAKLAEKPIGTGPVQVRGVEARRAAGARAQPRLLAGPGRRQPGDLPLHPRVQRAHGRAALGRDRHHEGRAAARGGGGRAQRAGPSCAPPCPRASTTWRW